MEQNDSNIILTPEAGPEHKGLRLDKFLALTVPDVSRSQVQRLIEQGMVSRDDDVLADNSYKVRPGDSYQIEIPPPEAAEPEPEDIPLEVVYEDEDGGDDGSSGAGVFPRHFGERFALPLPG